MANVSGASSAYETEWQNACVNASMRSKPTRQIKASKPVVSILTALEKRPTQRTLMVVCGPWRTPAQSFLKDIVAMLRVSSSHGIDEVVVLHPLFFYTTTSTREWWAYADDREADWNAVNRVEASISNIANDADKEMARGDLMRALRLEYTNRAEVELSISAVSLFVHAVDKWDSISDILLFGSSQGAALAAHVGVVCDSRKLRRVISHQPAGIYADVSWSSTSAKSDASFRVQIEREVVMRHPMHTAHGDLRQWGGRTRFLATRQRFLLACHDNALPKPCTQPNRTVWLSYGLHDTVAPPSLATLI